MTGNPNTFKCKSDEIFINFAYVCDKNMDCPSGDDEKNCDYHPSNFFYCQGDNKTVNYLRVCDHIEDCADGSDERFCQFQCQYNQT